VRWHVRSWRKPTPLAGRDGTLLLVAERNWPEMLARIAVMKALNWHQRRTAPAPRQNPAKVFRIVR